MRRDATLAGKLKICLSEHENDKVNVITQFRDAMLDLQPRIRFQKEEVASAVVK